MLCCISYGEYNFTCDGIFSALREYNLTKYGLRVTRNSLSVVCLVI